MTTRKTECVFCVLLVCALLADAVAQAKTDRARAGLLGPAQVVRTEAAEFKLEGGRSVAGRRVPVQAVTYDALGNALKRVDYNPDGSVAQTLVYGYDAAGRATGYEEYTGAMAAPRKHVYVLDERGNRIEYRLVQPDGKAGEKIVYRYDAQGRVVEELLQEHKGALISRNVYAYDAQGREVSQTRYNADGSVSSTLSNSYDAAGRLAERVRREGDVLTYRVRYAYDRAGRLIEQETVGSVVELDLPAGEAHAPGRVSYVYKGKERPRETISRAPDGSAREKVVIEYDSRGNWIRKTRLALPAGKGKAEPRRVEYRSITYF